MHFNVALDRFGQHFTAAMLLLLVCTATLPMAAIARQTTAERKVVIEQRHTSTNDEALARKQRSEQLLKQAGVPINAHLPVIETESEARRRTTEEVAHRAMALIAVSAKGEGIDQEVVDKIVKDYALTDALSPAEASFIRDLHTSEQTRTALSWRYEAAWVMLWALGYIDTLAPPINLCDVPTAVRAMRERTATQFIAQAKLRPLKQLLDEADLVYRQHWAIVDARINSREPPASLNPDVVMERHYALNWLIGYMGQEWDDISTDT